mmetsp:Transcript_5031/g.10884  ORF Transcript_5031/g.10884 Transcript_5031/m.10884 type:complete len:128 (+) Transcript_5031:3784-4167(+)
MRVPSCCVWFGCFGFVFFLSFCLCPLIDVTVTIQRDNGWEKRLDRLCRDLGPIPIYFPTEDQTKRKKGRPIFFVCPLFSPNPEQGFRRMEEFCLVAGILFSEEEMQNFSPEQCERLLDIMRKGRGEE